MRFAISSGGTAGHIYPAIAVAQELLARGHELIFVGSRSGQEAQLVPQENIEYKSFPAAGFNRYRPWTLLTSSLQLQISALKAKKWLRQFKPDAVACFGGYVSVPVGKAAAALKIPILIHEQNSAPGMANRYLAKHASAIALTYDDASKLLSIPDNARVQITGNPVRGSLANMTSHDVRASAREKFRSALGIPNEARVLLAFGGSQGAQHINMALMGIYDSLMAVHGLHVVQITGRRDYETIAQALKEHQNNNAQKSSRWHILDYCDNMMGAYAASDLVLSRAGASTLAEIALLALPTLLVPYPYATADHQSSNARSLVEAGAALVVVDGDLDKPVFSEQLLKLVSDVQLQSRMQKAACAMRVQNATARVADLLLEICH